MDSERESAREGSSSTTRRKASKTFSSSPRLVAEIAHEAVGSGSSTTG